MSRLDQYQAVCLYKFDRLGREQLAIGLLPYTFLSQGVKVLSPIDGEIDPASAESKFMFNMKGYLSEAERNNIRKRTSDALRNMRAQGKVVGNGVPLFGYLYERLGPGRRAGRRRVVNPQTEPIVRRIFEAVSKGTSLSALAKTLTLEGIPRPRNGKEWSPGTIEHIIQEPSYKGDAYATDRYKNLSVKIRSKSSKSYWKRTEGAPKPLGEPTPPIVSEDLWKAANDIVKGKKFKRASRPFEHWLRGRIICMDCDVKMGLV